jgi:hypothetical protein
MAAVFPYRAFNPLTVEADRPEPVFRVKHKMIDCTASDSEQRLQPDIPEACLP